MTPISKQWLDGVCKIGKGEACCRFIVVEPARGFVCAKHSSLAAVIDARVRALSMVARGNNCDGFPAVDEKENQNASRNN